MVDWDRVEQLRSKGWDWDRIADDSKVGFHPEASVREPGRALRALYHRQRSRARRQGPAAPSPKKAAEGKERRWTLARIGYLLTPVFAVWFVIAYFAPSPVGLVLPAIPYLALGLVVAAFLLLFGVWRSTGARWTKTFRTTLVAGVVIGLVVSGVIALAETLFFGCPYLPPASSLSSVSGSGTGSGAAQVPPWTTGSLPAWRDGGKPVVFFYGATWCPYCSAGSWAIYKALIEFGNVTGAGGALFYSDPGDVYPSTPEIVLSSIGYSSSWISFQVSEYAGDPSGHPFPGTSNCQQSAYFTAYGASSIPFLVVNGQYVHGGSQLVYPQDLAPYAASGAPTVLSQVQSESGSGWTAVQFQAYWVMAFLAKSTGTPVSSLARDLGWTSTTQAAVQSDVNQIG
jgi:thiol-disulfide isomerase/thioredoxin